MPSVFTAPTSPFFLIPGCVLVLVLAGMLLNGYRTTRQPVLLYAALGFVASAGAALWLGTYFALLPAFAVALVLYLREAGERAPVPASTGIEVVFRVWAAQARVQFGPAGAPQEVLMQGTWEHSGTVAAGTPLVLHVTSHQTSPLAAEVWCAGARVAVQQAPAGTPTLTLHATARPEPVVTA